MWVALLNFVALTFLRQLYPFRRPLLTNAALVGRAKLRGYSLLPIVFLTVT